MNNVDELFQSIESGRKGKNRGLSTGIPKLDGFIGGLQKSMYYLIFSDSGGGKTSLALYMLYRCLRNNENKKILIYYFSLEMSAKTLLAKLLCLYIYEEFGIVIKYQELMSWKDILNDVLYEYVLKSKEWLTNVSKNFIIYDKTLNRDSFYREMMILLEEHGEFVETSDGKRKFYKPNDPELLILGVIDHLALCVPKSGETKKGEMDAISAYAVTLKEKCGVSWIILQQANRSATNMERRKADLSECSRERS